MSEAPAGRAPVAQGIQSLPMGTGTPPPPTDQLVHEPADRAQRFLARPGLPR